MRSKPIFNKIAARRRQCARCHNKAATLLFEIRQYSFDIVGIAYLSRPNSNPHLRGSRLDDTQKGHVRGDFWNMQDSNAAQPRRDLVEIGEPFPADCRLKIVKAPPWRKFLRT